MWKHRDDFQRNLRFEALEKRCLLTTAVDYYNETLPQDVNGDGRVNAADALAVINLLNDPIGAHGEGGSKTSPLKWDVNNNGNLSAVDALYVINRLDAEAEGPALVQIALSATKLDGSALATTGDLPTIMEGEKFLIHVHVKDLRSDPKGIYTAYMDLTHTYGLMHVNMRENQRLVFKGDPEGGTFKLTFTNPISNVTRTTSDIIYDPVQVSLTIKNIENALLALDNIDPGEVTVAFRPQLFEDGPTYDVLFGGSFSNINIPSLAADSLGLTGGSNPLIAISELSGTNPQNQRDFRNSFGFGIYCRDVTTADNGGATIADDSVVNLIDEVGALCQHPTFGREVLLYQFEATGAEGGILALQTSPADILPAHPILLHGSDDGPLMPSEVLYGGLNLLVKASDTNSIWRNPINHLDVNNSGTITPTDALLIINYLNDSSSELYLPNSDVAPPPYLDTNGNQRVTATDALLVINYLNEKSATMTG